MESIAALVKAHPQGEGLFESLRAAGSWPVDTPGGRFYAEWETQAPVTREGQLMFFFQFLHAGDRWEELMRDCPLSYHGNRGSGKLNVMGTILLSVLCGHWRYAHINSVRGDRVNPALLGMEGTVSEDAVRAALKRMEETRSLAWLQGQILASIEPVLGMPWILDIDSTVKPLYGHQQGAQLGYNPQKPGRPSHVYHSYFVANLRISLGVEVRSGKEHAAAQGMPGLWQMLGALPRERWPTFVRGDCGYGSEKIMVEFEEQGLPYLLKLRHSPRVKTLVREIMAQSARWQNVGDGWEAAEASLKLCGWSRARRVVLVRESPAIAPVGAQARRRRDPFALSGAQGAGWEGQQIAPWSGRIAVLVTSLEERAYPTAGMPRLYRERADAEPSGARSPKGGAFARRAAPEGAGKTSMTNSKINGDGTGIRHANWPRAASWPTSSRCFTTGGTSTCASLMKPITARRSPVAPRSCKAWRARCKAADSAPSK